MSQEELLKLWEGLIKSLQQRLSSAHISTYFQGSAPIEITSKGTLVVGLPNAFIKATMEKKYSEDIFNFFHSKDSSIKKIIFKTVQLKKEQVVNIPAVMQNTSHKQSNSGIREINIHNRYTLENFIVGDNNQLAYAASKAVSDKPGISYNPFFIYGGVGLGKTHLLQAIANKIKKQKPNMNILYVTAEEFTNQLIESISGKNVKVFRAKYRTRIDMLILDDIQFIEGKEKTQEELFHTFNSLYGANKQIIISSDKPPNDLKTLEERLRSRFAAGMVADITKPDLETRIAILRAKVQEKGYLVTTDVLQLIAEYIDSNVRELEAVLIQLIDESELLQIEPSMDLAKKIIKRLFPEKLNKNKNVNYYITAEHIINVTSEYFDITPAEITGNSRKKEISLPRHVAMYLSRTVLSLPYETIGTLFGNRNHTTIMHAISKIEDQIQDNMKIVKAVNTIKRNLGL